MLVHPLRRQDIHPGHNGDYLPAGVVRVVLGFLYKTEGVENDTSEEPEEVAALQAGS